MQKRPDTSRKDESVDLTVLKIDQQGPRKKHEPPGRDRQCVFEHHSLAGPRRFFQDFLTDRLDQKINDRRLCEIPNRERDILRQKAKRRKNPRESRCVKKAIRTGRINFGTPAVRDEIPCLVKHREIMTAASEAPEGSDRNQGSYREDWEVFFSCA